MDNRCNARTHQTGGAWKSAARCRTAARAVSAQDVSSRPNEHQRWICSVKNGNFHLLLLDSTSQPALLLCCIPTSSANNVVQVLAVNCVQLAEPGRWWLATGFAVPCGVSWAPSLQERRFKSLVPESSKRWFFQWYRDHPRIHSPSSRASTFAKLFRGHCSFRNSNSRDFIYFHVVNRCDGAHGHGTARTSYTPGPRQAGGKRKGRGKEG